MAWASVFTSHHKRKPPLLEIPVHAILYWSTVRAAVGENPIDAHNHALAALRYLVTRIDGMAPRRDDGATV